MGRHRSTLHDIGTVREGEDVKPQAGHTATDSSGLVASVADEAAAGVDMEEDDDGNDGEEDADGDDHDSAGDDKANGAVTYLGPAFVLPSHGNCLDGLQLIPYSEVGKEDFGVGIYTHFRKEATPTMRSGSCGGRFAEEVWDLLVTTRFFFVSYTP